jgi:cobyrinic acid a,c-diamide synthase
MMATKVRKRLAVSMQTAQKFSVEIFNLRQLNELEVSKEDQVKISKRFAGLENSNNSEEINRVWENVKEYFKTSKSLRSI